MAPTPSLPQLGEGVREGAETWNLKPETQKIILTKINPL